MPATRTKRLNNPLRKLYRASLKMSEELGREPIDEELSEEIGISSGRLSQLKTVSIAIRRL
jgi:RNA polymerase primary sigma factor